MQQYDSLDTAIAERAKSERLYLHYALLLAIVLVAIGITTIALGLGDKLDIVVKGRDDLEARILNASPGVLLWLIGGAVFWSSRPRQLKGSASHSAVNQTPAPRVSGNTPRPPSSSTVTDDASIGRAIAAFEIQMRKRFAEIDAELEEIREAQFGVFDGLNPLRNLGVANTTGQSAKLLATSEGVCVESKYERVLVPEGVSWGDVTLHDADRWLSWARAEKKRLELDHIRKYHGEEEAARFQRGEVSILFQSADGVLRAPNDI